MFSMIDKIAAISLVGVLKVRDENVPVLVRQQNNFKSILKVFSI